MTTEKQYYPIDCNTGGNEEARLDQSSIVRHIDPHYNCAGIGRKDFDCKKYNKRVGQGCDLNNNCRYPNCTMWENSTINVK